MNFLQFHLPLTYGLGRSCTSQQQHEQGIHDISRCEQTLAVKISEIQTVYTVIIKNAVFMCEAINMHLRLNAEINSRQFSGFTYTVWNCTLRYTSKKWTIEVA